jgi:hypothetical protein
MDSYSIECSQCGKLRTFSNYRSYQKTIQSPNQICRKCAHVNPLKGGLPKFEKKCPQCGKTQTFKTWQNLYASTKRNQRCKSCVSIGNCTPASNLKRSISHKLRWSTASKKERIAATKGIRKWRETLTPEESLFVLTSWLLSRVEIHPHDGAQS